MIALASSSTGLRRSFREALTESYRTVEVSDLAGVTRVLQALKLKVVFVDPTILEPNSLAVLRTLTLQNRSVGFIVFGYHGDLASELNLLHAGARGILRYDSPPEIAARVVRSVLRGELWVSRRLLTAFLDEAHTANGFGLSPPKAVAGTAKPLSVQETRIARVAATGLTNKEIAAAFGISERTVKGHLTRLFKKLGITSRAELIRLLQTARESAFRARRAD